METVQDEISPFEALLKAREDRLDKIKGEEIVRNFAEAMGLVSRVDNLIKVAKELYQSSAGDIERADGITKLLERVNSFIEHGRNDEAIVLFNHGEGVILRGD